MFLFSQNSQVITQQEAHYPKGDQELFKYIFQNIKYPKAPIGEKIKGEIMLSFDVQPDSTITNVTTLKDVGFEIEKDIIKAIKKLKYAPAIQNGTKVPMNIIISVPIHYVIRE